MQIWLLFLIGVQITVSLNLSKCKPTIFGTSILLAKINYNDTYKVKIKNNCLSFETSIVNLCIRMSSNLSWSDQVDYIHKKVYQSLYQFTEN